ncbi:hypothetical protein TVNIR_3168 [Thioalkalivibrio nitratireducens DSM 14787]|uniref:Uncharacterized protein n=1 Tax=Thioalkalivibrio nitratireducens (strain DSM 14787 / UNIQEM 213 / ALEN2) TaxID=1255043 RepID=L0DYZ4_THIND|nr:hypothetical protein TVNIR_3168 [Thioalkalivibrio nitratireducens DSM 14787]
MATKRIAGMARCHRIIRLDFLLGTPGLRANADRFFML